MTHTGSRIKSEIKKVSLKEYKEFQRIDIHGNMNKTSCPVLSRIYSLVENSQESGELLYAIFGITCLGQFHDVTQRHL